MEIRMGCDQAFQMRLHDQFLAMTHAIEQPDFAFRLFGQAPVHHAQHRRNANAATDQDYWCSAPINVEMSGRGPYLEKVADPHLIVEMVGRAAWWNEAAAWGRYSFD